MRQAINNLQSTHSGFGFVSQDNVFKICDQPHPIVVRRLIKHCQKGEIDDALTRINTLWEQGYSAVDIVVTVFRVVKGMEELPEYTRLEYIRVSGGCSGDGAGLTATGDWVDTYADIGGSRHARPAGGDDREAVSSERASGDAQVVDGPDAAAMHAVTTAMSMLLPRNRHPLFHSRC